MTNLEKWQEEIIEIKNKNKAYLHPAVVNGKPMLCTGLVCADCDLRTPCSDSFIKWLFDEYKELRKLTKQQMAFCEAVETGWMARDKGGTLFWYCDKPVKTVNAWHSGCGCPCVGISNYIFPEFLFIRWEDEEPYSIEDMLTWEVENGDE